MELLDQMVTIGKTDIQVTLMGLGAWSWGDRMVWSYGSGYGDADIRAAFDASLEAGINFIDTAEAYGAGRSERLIGNFLAGSASPLVIATKFMPYPWRWTKAALSSALRRSLERLKLEKVDLYQIHWDWPPVSIETWADALADVVQQGLARAVGVSNYDEAQMRRANAVLAKRGVPLASNQVEYSLIHRHVEFNGVLKACQELNITLIAYSPIGMGVLTGKYGPDKPLPGFRGRRYNRAYLQKVQPLMSLIGEVGRAHDGKTSSQVALNWLMCKGVLPIPGAKNLHQARENIGALGWRLSESEVKALDEASANLR